MPLATRAVQFCQFCIGHGERHCLRGAICIYELVGVTAPIQLIEDANRRNYVLATGRGRVLLVPLLGFDHWTCGQENRHGEGKEDRCWFIHL
jgi:hypothetical protein